jgi:hypothetical protein
VFVPGRDGSFRALGRSFASGECFSAPLGVVTEIEASSERVLNVSVIEAAAPANVTFVVASGSITGELKCVGECPTVQLTLTNGVAKHELTARNGGFVFPAVEYGDYELGVPGTDEWNDPIRVSVMSPVLNVRLEQKFGRFHVDSNMELVARSGGVPVGLKRGPNELKLKVPVLEPGDCHNFKRLDLGKARATLSVVSVNRSVEVEGGEVTLFIDGVELAGRSFVQNLTGPTRVEAKALAPLCVNPPALEIQPSDRCEVAHVVKVVRCADVMGVIEPPVGDVTVSVVTPDGVVTTQTDASGTYQFTGLLDEPAGLTASKSGWRFTLVPNTRNFRATPICQLNISVEGEYSGGILWSLSTMSGNAESSVSHGSTASFDLSCEIYSVRPILAEHRFEPLHAAVDVTTTQAITFVVRRVQFAVFGRVLQGKTPASGIQFEALAENGDRQVGASSADGRWRIIGLDANQTVAIVPRTTGTRVVPIVVHVPIEEDEVGPIDFFVGEDEPPEVRCIVKAAPELEGLQVTLSTSGGTLLKTLMVGQANIVIFSGINATHTKMVVTGGIPRRADVNCTKAEARPGSLVTITCQSLEQKREEAERATAGYLPPELVSCVVIVLWLVYFNLERLGLAGLARQIGIRR